MANSGIRPRISLAFLFLVLLTSPSHATDEPASKSLRIELVAVVDGIDSVRLRASNATLVAESLAKDTRPGPTIRIFPDESPLEMKATWREGGRERAWSDSIPWSDGDSLLLEIGDPEAGVRVVRETD